MLALRSSAVAWTSWAASAGSFPPITSATAFATGCSPLSKFYSEESIQSLGEGVENFQRWGLAQGQGALIGALRGEQPVANAVADVIGGKDPAEAAKEVQATAEELQAGLQ